MRFWPLLLALLLLVSCGTTVAMPATAKLWGSTSPRFIDVYHDDFADHIDVFARANRTVYFHIFLTSCINCSDGLVQETITIWAGEVLRLGSIRQLDRNSRWSYSLSWESEHRFPEY